MTPPPALGASALSHTMTGDVVPWWKDNGLRKLIAWQSLVLASQMIVGYDEVVASGFQSMKPWKEAMGNPDASMIGIITAIIFVGGFAGAIVAAFPADMYGRRPAMLFGLLLAIAGSALQAAAPTRNVFIGGRLVLGFGISFTTTAGPSLMNELGHPRLRGRMAGMFNVLWYVGSIIAAWLSFGTGHLNTSWSWRIPSIVQTCLPAVIFAGVCFMPESPRWLYSKGRAAEAERILIKYHANGDASSELVAIEIAEIAAALAAEKESKQDSWRHILSSRTNRRSLGIAVSVAVLTLWTGQSVITFYFSPILDSVGITSTNQQTGINGGMAIWNLLCSITGAVLVERIGRRPLWLTSFIGMILANVPLTISCAMYTDHGSQPAAYVVIVFLFLYNAAFNLACNPLLYCYSPEVLPYSLRNRGLALQILVSQACLTVNQYVNPIALDRIGYWYFVFYLGMNFLAIAIVYFTFPETKGYTLEELSTIFENGGSARAPVLLGKFIGDTEIGTAPSIDEKKLEAKERSVGV